MTDTTTRPLRPETLAVHAGTTRSPFGETSEALFLTQGFTYPDMETAEARFKARAEGTFIYSRFGNPTVAMFEERMAALEGAETARATATGMAGVAAALLGPLRAGDHLVASRVLFGSCHYIVTELLPKFGIETTLVDGTDLDAWRGALRPTTRAFFLESPANPTLELVDIAAIARIAREAGALLVVDNALGIPTVSRPLDLGADIVTYSATKHIDGQGRCLGGLVMGAKALIEERIQPYLRHTGPALSPFNAWVMLKGLETLSVRVRAQTQNALAMARALERAEGVARVRYPGLETDPFHALCRKQMTGGGTVLAVDLEGGKEAAFAFGRALQVIRISNNFGDAKSMVTHPATTTHERFSPAARAEIGIGDGMLRISAGLEHPDDLVDDVLAAAQAAARMR
ncbi:O-succinylhomoserine sulfhydrylase [Salinarimonas sp.]|uniref:O-succinylhomoserine sulfhydrylase n=1 Tax=Salinarimonas sp. TaxID=2766526 RepID=UPI00391CB7F4